MKGCCVRGVSKELEEGFTAKTTRGVKRPYPFIRV